MMMMMIDISLHNITFRFNYFLIFVFVYNIFCYFLAYVLD